MAKTNAIVAIKALTNKLAKAYDVASLLPNAFLEFFRLEFLTLQDEACAKVTP